MSMRSQSTLDTDGTRGSQVPTISVLMSVYNDEEYLERAIESILNQTYRDFEFLITDDSSTDRSRSIIQQYAERDDRIRGFVNAENRGLTKTLNDMIQRASGRFIARMDADDIARRHRFEKQVRVFDSERPVDVVFGNTRFIDKRGTAVCVSWRPDENEVVEQLGTRCYIPHPTVMVRTAAIKEVDGYDESYWTGQDHDLWRRMKESGATFHYIPEVLLDYRLNPNSVHAGTSDDYWFRVSNVCIWNRSKMRALRYLNRLAWWQSAVTIAKLFVPHSFMSSRGEN